MIAQLKTVGVFLIVVTPVGQAKLLTNFEVPNNPAPIPIVPKEPSLDVRVFITDNSPLRLLVMVIIPSELTILPITCVNVLPSLFIEPSQLLADSMADSMAEPLPAA